MRSNPNDVNRMVIGVFLAGMILMIFIALSVEGFI